MARMTTHEKEFSPSARRNLESINNLDHRISELEKVVSSLAASNDTNQVCEEYKAEKVFRDLELLESVEIESLAKYLDDNPDVYQAVIPHD